MLKHAKPKLKECYIFSSGGLGDIILDYFTKFEWLKVIDIKNKYDVSINVLLKTTNKTAKEFFEYNPYFNKVYFEDFESDDPTRLNFPKFSKITNEIKCIKHKLPIFLNKEEEFELQEVLNSGPYITVHPFAGEDFRSWSGKINLNNFIDNLIDRGFSVVVLGGSHFREAKIKNQREQRNEFFDYNCFKLFNKVGKAGPRLSAALIEQSNYFIGTSSCYLTTSWCFENKSIAIVPDGKFLPAGNWWGETMHEKSSVITFSELSKLNQMLDELL